MAPLLCRFCLSDAHEAICLDCKAKFQALERENEYLRKQVSIHRRQNAARYRETVARVKRKVRAK